MRTTLTIDNDVLERARAIAAKLRTPLKTVINEALRVGLDHVEQPAKSRPYKTEPHAMGLRSGRNLDNIQELLAQIEGEDPLLDYISADAHRWAGCRQPGYRRPSGSSCN